MTRRAGDPYLLVQVYGRKREWTVRIGRSHALLRPHVMRTHGGWIGYGGWVYATARRATILEVEIVEGVTDPESASED